MFSKELKIKIYNALKDKPNYVGFSFGHKKTNGVNTKQFSIIVYVSKKQSDLPEQDRIPLVIEGYKTDVQPAYNYSHLAVNTNYHCVDCNDINTLDVPTECNYTDQVTSTYYSLASQVTSLPHKSKFQVGTTGNNYGKPAIAGGMSGSSLDGGPCTTTIIARDIATNKLLVLGNQHCLPFVTSNDILPGINKMADDIVYNTEVKQTISGKIWKQGEGSNKNNIAVFYKTNYQAWINAVPNSCATTNACYLADIAAYTLLPDVVSMPGIFELGDGPFKWMTREGFCNAYCGTPDCSDCAGNTIYVYKSGRTTGTQTPQEGYIIVDVDVDLTSANRKYSGIIQIQHSIDFEKPFGGGGDSGSPVLMEHEGELKLLGVLTWGGTYIEHDINGNPIGTPVVISICPIWQVAEALQVKAWDFEDVPGEADGAIVVQSEDPSITIANRPYIRLQSTTLPVTHTKD